eukprot:TRINITY_DN4866_c0_g1_i1.p3 TRINITY_DN4866_c0_g1~~TRINITY_DN4866_c0_g1_i1.p3  ORF type:complete len:322 (+),score=95.54 TRINITY_DN4866_c0_g1_i1:54-968(+)
MEEAPAAEGPVERPGAGTEGEQDALTCAADRDESELFALADGGQVRFDHDELGKWRDRWCKEQLELRANVLIADVAPWKPPGAARQDWRPALRRVAGVDISFAKGTDQRGCATLVVMDVAAQPPVVLCEMTEMVELTMPYISGFLAFREVPHLVRLVERVRREKPEAVPECILVDGSGVLHPRGFGCACHLGVLTNIPAIGVAKNFLNVDGLDTKTVLQMCRESAALSHAGGSIGLKGKSGRLWGHALRTTAKSSNPVFVSAGHMVTNATAAAVVAGCSTARVPEPIRQADLRSRDFLRQRGML